MKELETITKNFKEVTVKELERGLYDDWIKGLNLVELVPSESSRAYLAQAMIRFKDYAIDYHNNDNMKIVDCYKVLLPDELSYFYIWGLE